MPPAPLPPMTSRQAKKLGKKQTGQCTYTATQMRKADRREELDKRKRQAEEREARKIVNKRKREEQEEKERNVKRRQLQEGRITLEDTWGKVPASQPRLTTFFNAPRRSTRNVLKASDNVETSVVDSEAENKENECGSTHPQGETLVNKAPIIHPVTDLGEEISDDDLLQLISSQLHLPKHPSPSSAQRKTVEMRSQTRSRTNGTVSTVKIMSPAILKRRRTPSPEAADDADNAFFNNQYVGELIVAEDDTAEETSDHVADLEALAACFSSPSKSSRSVLSEMSVASVNTRAQEKPDITSAPLERGLATPSRPRDPFASFNSADFEDDDSIMWDKENSDPLQTPETGKTKGKKISEGLEKTEAGPSRSIKKSPPVGFSNTDNFEDIYDFDLNDGITEDDFDDEIDDATLMTLATQRPRGGDKIIDTNGSPRKLSLTRNALLNTDPLEYTPGQRMMPPPPPKSKLLVPSPAKPRKEKSSAEKKPESLSFASVGDDDLLEIADQIEEQLSQKGKEPESDMKVPAFKKKKKRTLPWQVNPLPPPSTQDYLMMMADEVDAEMEG